MKIRFFSPAAVVALVFFAAPVLSSAAASQPAKAKLVLDKGMEAATIINSVGKPDEIQPISSDGNLKAEKWLYRRKLSQAITQIASTERAVPAMVSSLDGFKIGTMSDPVYRLKYITTYQVTSLLFIEDKLHTGRQWLERTEEYAD